MQRDYIVSESDDPNQILCTMAENIEKFGWIKGKYHDANTGAVCMMGALRVSVFGSVSYPNVMSIDDTRLTKLARVVDVLNNRIKKKLGGAFVEIPLYNDSPTTTIDDVLSLLKEDC